MVILTEQERLLTTEENLINNSTMYGTSSSTLALLHDYGNVTLDSDGLFVFKYDLTPGSTGDGLSYACLMVGSLKAHACNAAVGSGQKTYGGIVWLAAGTYDIKLYGATQTTDASYAGKLQVGTLQFLDQDGQELAVYSSILSLTLQSRITPLGPLKNAVYAVQVVAYTAGGITNFENPGDSFTNGVSITVDGVQQSWTERFNDINMVLAAGAKLFLARSVGVAHTIGISKKNSNTAVNISLVVCPWIMCSQAYAPVDTSFSQGSTVYYTLEPLFLDGLKFSGVGIGRAVTFGQSTDYYNSSSAGTGLLQYSFVFDIVDVNMDVLVYGLGGCIGIIAADMR